MLKTPSDIIDEAYSYISIIALFVGVMLSYNLFSGILKAMGNSFMPLIFLIISTAINVVLDYIFIAVANMGIRGAAVATVIAEFTSAVLCMIYLSKIQGISARQKGFQIRRQAFRRTLGAGTCDGIYVLNCINRNGYFTVVY